MLREANVVGMTTTGVAMHQNLVEALGANIVVVEEAAEASIRTERGFIRLVDVCFMPRLTPLICVLLRAVFEQVMEAHILAVLTQSTQHLILIGELWFDLLVRNVCSS